MRRRSHVRNPFFAACGFVACLAAACAGTDEFGEQNDATRGGPVLEDWAQRQQAIIDGYVDADTTAVVGVGLVENERFIASVCTGTLIAPNLVLTARHCVSEIIDEGEGGKVQCGQSEFLKAAAAGLFIISPHSRHPTDPNEAGTVRGRRIHVIPDVEDDVCGYDLALIILRENIPSEVAQPIVPRIDVEPQAEERFSAAGFGRSSATGNLSVGTRRRTDDLTVLCANADCARFAGAEAVRTTEWLAVGDGACDGDSGGPALDAEGRVIGVVSRGDEACGVTVYGDVASFGDFIVDVAVEAAELGGYEPPFWVNGSSEPPVLEPESAEGATDDLELEGALDQEPCNGAACPGEEIGLGAEGCSVRTRGQGRASDIGFGLMALVALTALRRRR